MKKSVLIAVCAALLAFLTVAPAPAAEARVSNQSQKKSVQIFALVNNRGDQKFAYERYYAQTYGAPAGTKVRLQQKVKGKWKTLSTTKVKLTHKSQGVGVVKFNMNTSKLTTKTQSFRFYVSATKTTKAAKQNFKAHGSAKKYRAYEKRAENYIKQWCPGVPVYTKKIKGRASGLAYADYMDYGSTGGLVTSAYIQIAPGMSKKNLKIIATHECAHILQLRQTTRAGKTTSTASGYGARGRVSQHEIEADCMAVAMMGKSYRSGYTQHKPCTKKEVAKAKKIVKRYGKLLKKERGTFTRAQVVNAYKKANR